MRRSHHAFRFITQGFHVLITAHARAMPLLSVPGVLLLALDRTSRVSRGPAWAATQKHRPLDTPVRADQPLGKGLGKTRGQVVRQPRVERIAASWGCWEGGGNPDRARAESHRFHPWGTYV